MALSGPAHYVKADELLAEIEATLALSNETETSLASRTSRWPGPPPGCAGWPAPTPYRPGSRKAAAGRRTPGTRRSPAACPNARWRRGPRRWLASRSCVMEPARMSVAGARSLRRMWPTYLPGGAGRPRRAPFSCEPAPDQGRYWQVSTPVTAEAITRSSRGAHSFEPTRVTRMVPAIFGGDFKCRRAGRVSPLVISRSISSPTVPMSRVE